jgi:pilus assembly protein Flp/PilA
LRKRDALHNSSQEGATVVRKAFETMKSMWPAVTQDESGQGLVEYSLILAFVAIVAIAAVTFLGSDMSVAFDHIGTSL